MIIFTVRIVCTNQLDNILGCSQSSNVNPGDVSRFTEMILLFNDTPFGSF